MFRGTKFVKPSEFAAEVRETPPPVSKLCKYRSPTQIDGRRRQELGLAHAREWYDCGHPDKPLGPYVCPCAGCNSKCTGFKQGEG